MVSAVNTPLQHRPQNASSQHQYGTRIRSNSSIKPPARLQSAVDAPTAFRRIKPSPTTKPKANAMTASTPPLSIPDFPPPHVMLHPDDASSKVFLSIGRSFMSVNNRAMTIKDLADMCMKFGLLCQNASAAGQAITTFVRNHLQRCEIQQDQPLLLKHSLSGTIADDDLVPALYSRVGGAHCTQNESENRITNFRRGTVVWYLSKAAGAPCPFSREGIRLCDYNENGRVGMSQNPGKERKRERDRLRKATQCGQKRKRLTRACADKGAESDSVDEEEQKRPPKVKLTLRLPCLVPPRSSSLSTDSGSATGSPGPLDPTDLSRESEDESDDDSMSVVSSTDDDPPTSYPQTFPSGLPHPSLDDQFSLAPPTHDYRRELSVPYSTMSGSPPPDSEDEDDDYHNSMTGHRTRRLSLIKQDDDEDSIWEGELMDMETDTWESPGPRSPSVQVEDDVIVKQEPTDVRGYLDAWDDLDTQAAEQKVIDIVAQAAAAELGFQVGRSEPHIEDSPWNWDVLDSSTDSPRMKQEEFDDGIFSDRELSPAVDSPLIGYDPCGSAVDDGTAGLWQSGSWVGEQWRDVEILGPDSLEPKDLEDGCWSSPRKPRFGPSTACTPRKMSPRPIRTALPSFGTSRSASPSDVAPRNVVPSVTSPSLVQSMVSLSLQIPSTTESLAPLSGSARSPKQPQAVAETTEIVSIPPDGLHIVQPTSPLTPPIVAVEFEGVPVFLLRLGSRSVLRRIDTDYVNVSPIVQYLNIACPAEAVPNAISISTGSRNVCGTWVPLVDAQTIAGDDPLFKTFLSDDLSAHFPPHLEDLRLDDGRGFPSSQYGHQFLSVSDARRRTISSHRMELPPREFDVSWARGHFEVEDHLLHHPPFVLANAPLDPHLPPEEAPITEAPLSPSEEEMFRVLCVAPDWDAAKQASEEIGEDQDAPEPSSSSAPKANEERPLRRSKRVPKAVVARSRTRSSKRGSRTSLS